MVTEGGLTLGDEHTQCADGVSEITQGTYVTLLTSVIPVNVIKLYKIVSET